jgi:hypothetical protein
MNYDVAGKRMTDAFGWLGLMNTAQGNFYFRSNCLNRFIGLGWFDGRCCGELQYDVNRKAVGLGGQPVFIRAGYQDKLSDSSSMNLRFNIGQEAWTSMKWDLNVSPQLKFSITDRFNLRALFTDPKNAAYSNGMSFEFKV